MLTLPKIMAGFAGILGLAALWILLAELPRPGLHALSENREEPGIIASRRSEAALAARFGLIRGDLWAEAARAYGDLIWPGDGATGPADAVGEEARDRAIRALSLAPEQSAMWLLLAGLAFRYGWTTPSPTEALKLSYYTGPNEETLIPARLLVVARSDAIGDADVRQLVENEIQNILSHKPALRPAILAAYRVARPKAKAFMETVVSVSDAALLQAMRTGAPLR